MLYPTNMRATESFSNKLTMHPRLRSTHHGEALFSPVITGCLDCLREISRRLYVHRFRLMNFSDSCHSEQEIVNSKNNKWSRDIALKTWLQSYLAEGRVHKNNRTTKGRWAAHLIL